MLKKPKYFILKSKDENMFFTIMQRNRNIFLLKHTFILIFILIQLQIIRYQATINFTKYKNI